MTAQYAGTYSALECGGLWRLPFLREEWQCTILEFTVPSVGPQVWLLQWDLSCPRLWWTEEGKCKGVSGNSDARGIFGDHRVPF